MYCVYIYYYKIFFNGVVGGIGSNRWIKIKNNRGLIFNNGVDWEIGF